MQSNNECLHAVTHSQLHTAGTHSHGFKFNKPP